MNIPLFLTLTYLRKIVDIFPDFSKTSCHWLFYGHCSSKVFETLHYYNLVWHLPIHARFDDFDLVSRSQVCQNHKLQIVLDSKIVA